ncbi:MAG: hypothetical protein FRX48_08477 [Lasallia pustulata]|uniref:Mitochondrial outer membrane protein n=1 Tax=Lasallia pustulata TaxID=136370 RepID=A0A5M8PE64_9LECA|nr:MAG: hypothetical protein FRX48_08477 [Lasallia pustulata]
MPVDEDDGDNHGRRGSASGNPPSPHHAPQHWWSMPTPIRRLFDKFPLQTYPANELPQRTAGDRSQHLLYVFTTPEAARRGDPSFNPSCLKWQTYLKVLGVDHKIVLSNNHASPTGALPFVLPSATSPTPLADVSLPIGSNKIQRWIRELKISAEEISDFKYDAYLALIDHRIRNAWLYTLYLEPTNFAAVAQHLYITPCSSNALVRATIAHQLRSAAAEEVSKHTATIDVESVHNDAQKAFAALSTLLGGSEYFFGVGKPSLFDASVFSYTHLLLDKRMGWMEDRMTRGLEKYQNLVQHRERILEVYYQKKPS